MITFCEWDDHHAIKSFALEIHSSCSFISRHIDAMWSVCVYFTCCRSYFMCSALDQLLLLGESPMTTFHGPFSYTEIIKSRLVCFKIIIDCNTFPIYRWQSSGDQVMWYLQLRVQITWAPRSLLSELIFCLFECHTNCMMAMFYDLSH